MSPIIHGRIYPEAESSALLRHELRVLIDPCLIASVANEHLMDLDVLRHYLRSLPGQPCQITLISTAEAIRTYGGEFIYLASDVLPEVTVAFGESGKRYPEIMVLASTAFKNDADIIVMERLPEEVNFQEICRKLFISFEDWATAKRSCEIFVRGHEVPWSFRFRMWGCPWTAFYFMAEPSSQLIELYNSAAKTPMDSDIVELIRSLAFNRYPSLCYTRDKLLFYVQQRRAANRHKLRQQDFTFEAGYFLNHYYLLLWAGLDQICWIVNGIFELGLTGWRKVGPLNHKFLEVLRDKAESVSRLFENENFVHWAKILRAARHFAAHRGFAMPSPIFIKPDKEPSEEELDREIEASDRWQLLDRFLPREILEGFRPFLRAEARLSRSKELPERALPLKIEGKEVLIHPLVNIEWDFKNFFDFAHKVADLALDRLKRKH